jgi:hypothetical protein
MGPTCESYTMWERVVWELCESCKGIIFPNFEVKRQIKIEIITNIDQHQNVSENKLLKCWGNSYAKWKMHKGRYKEYFSLLFFLFFFSVPSEWRKNVIQVSIIFDFQGYTIIETFLCIIAHPKVEEPSCLKVEANRPIRRYYLGLDSIFMRFGFLTILLFRLLANMRESIT